jgi:hypothetical protein
VRLVEARVVVWSPGHGGYDPAFEQLDALGVGEDARVTQPMELLDAERPGRRSNVENAPFGDHRSRL